MGWQGGSVVCIPGGDMPSQKRVGFFYSRLVFIASGKLAWSWNLRLKFVLVFLLSAKIALAFLMVPPRPRPVVPPPP